MNNSWMTRGPLHEPALVTAETSEDIGVTDRLSLRIIHLLTYFYLLRGSIL